MDIMQQIRWASSGFKESYLGPKMGLSKIIRKGMPELIEPTTHFSLILVYTGFWGLSHENQDRVPQIHFFKLFSNVTLPRSFRWLPVPEDLSVFSRWYSTLNVIPFIYLGLKCFKGQKLMYCTMLYNPINCQTCSQSRHMKVYKTSAS